jgi:type 1 glutamine amidotransferase
MTRALIVFGGWEKHDPEGVARLLTNSSWESGKVTPSSFATLKELDLTAFDPIVPVWDSGDDRAERSPRCWTPSGAAWACRPAWRDRPFGTKLSFIICSGVTGDHFDFAVRAHQIHMDGEPSPITAGSVPYTVTTEQYYLLVDPANTVLATMRVGDADASCLTKYYGKGRVSTAHLATPRTSSGSRRR